MKKSKYNYLVLGENGQHLLFNTRNHALVELDDISYDNYMMNDMPSAFSDELFKLGFLVPDEVDEIEEIERVRNEYCLYHPQINLTIMTTERCNFRCPYCYQTHKPSDLSASGTEALGKFLLYVSKHQTKTVNIHWFGGEPLLNLDPIIRIEHLLKEEQLEGYSQLTTNGYLLTNELLDCLKNETRISSFQITLDGLPEQHNKTRVHVSGEPTYETICQNIVNSINKGFFVTIRLNLNKKNANLDPFFENLEILHLDKTKYAVHITNANQFDKSEEIDNFYYDSAEEYSKAYNIAQESFINANYAFPRNYTKKVGCEFECNNTFLIGCDLSLYFCTSCELDEFYKQGYITSNGEMHLNGNYKKRNDFSVFNDEECRDCLVLPMCMGGCTLKRIQGQKFCIPEKYILGDYVLRLYEEAEKNQNKSEEGGECV